jgi:beta-hydroxylase
MDSIAYKIETSSAWAKAQSAGAYTGSALDETDGFIHLSALDQVRATLAMWFKDQPDLILAKIDLTPLGDTVMWEASRGGALFPHIYGPIPMSAVREVIDLALLADGSHDLPQIFP